MTTAQLARARAITSSGDGTRRPHIVAQTTESAATVARSLQRLFRQQQARERLRMRNRQIDVDMAVQVPLPDEHDEL